MKQPLLKLVGCYRGKEFVALRAQFKLGRRITVGGLKGCVRLPTGPTARLGRGYVLLFKPVIRV